VRRATEQVLPTNFILTSFLSINFKHQLDILIFFQVCNFRMIDGVWKVLVIVLFATASPLILVALYQQTFRYLRRKRERELERIWRMTHDEAEEEGAVAQ
jgi:hypothetical protein